MGVAALDDDPFGARYNNEYFALNGSYPQNDTSGFRNYNELNLSWIRDRYTHEQILARQVTYPAGYGFWGTLEQAGQAMGAIIKAAAPFIGMIPGLGTGVAMAITLGAGIAGGDRIDAALIDTVQVAIPAGAQKSYRNAVDISYAAARGQRVDQLLIDAARKEASDRGGPQAAAAFDAGIALGTGKGLQDAGFQVMGAWCKSNDTPVARALQFGLDVRSAAAAGMSVRDFLINQASQEFLAKVPVVQQAFLLKQAIEYFLAHPEEILDPQTADLADRLGIPIEAIRAAIICLRRMSDGTLVFVPENAAKFQSPFYKETYVPSATQGLSVMTTKTLGRAISAEDKALLASNAAKGAAIAASNPVVMAARNLVTDSAGKTGFDVGSGVCQGFSLPGPGKDRVKNLLAATGVSTNAASAIHGFEIAEAIQYGITKQKDAMAALSLSSHPAVAAGQLAANGLANQPAVPVQQKQAVFTSLTSTAATAAGAQAAITANKSFWSKLKEFFGLG